jgi:hypothetical protein
MYIGLKMPVIDSRLQQNFNFLNRFFKKYSSNFIKIRPLGAELFHADGQTDITKLTGAFRNFGNAPKNVQAVLLTEESTWPAEHDKMSYNSRYPKIPSQLLPFWNSQMSITKM